MHAIVDNSGRWIWGNRGAWFPIDRSIPTPAVFSTRQQALDAAAVVTRLTTIPARPEPLTIPRRR